MSIVKLNKSKLAKNPHEEKNLDSILYIMALNNAVTRIKLFISSEINL